LYTELEKTHSQSRLQNATLNEKEYWEDEEFEVLPVTVASEWTAKYNNLEGI
jgi:hypothetical protein